MKVKSPECNHRAASSGWHLDNQAIHTLTGQGLRADLHRLSDISQSTLKKYSRLGTLMAVSASLSFSTSNSFAQSGPSIETAQPTRLTAAPAVSSPIEMKTLPEATCLLHAEGATSADPALRLFADDEGTVRFHVRPSTESDQLAHFEVDCASNGKMTTFPLHLRSSSSPTEDMPAPTVETAKSRPGAYVRPALTKDDALHLATEDLVRHGYPLRPDPEQAPEAFTSWLKAVTHPSTFVAPRSVAHPGIRHSPLEAANISATLNLSDRSGFELRAPTSNSTLDAVIGTWFVPTISGYEFNNETYSSLWVGLEGADPNSPTLNMILWQAGTDQDAIDLIIPYVGELRFASYYAWTDFLTTQNASPSTTIANFTVNPGDEIITQVWIGGQGQWPPSLSGAYAIAFVENLSRNQWTTIFTCRVTWGPFCDPSPPQFPGDFAEWIMERPSKCPNGTNCVTQDLADYGQALMSNPIALREDLGTGWEAFTDGISINMISGSDLLSAASAYNPVACTTVNPLAKPTCSPVNANPSILFTWHNFH